MCGRGAVGATWSMGVGLTGRTPGSDPGGPGSSPGHPAVLNRMVLVRFCVKTCGACGQELDELMFNRKGAGLQSKCRACQKDYAAGHYRSNKDKYYAKARKQKSDNRSFVESLKTGKSCLDCGVSYPPFVLEFDHRPGEVKLHNVSQMAFRSGVAAIMAEIAKCDLVCANCHRVRTYSRGQQRFQ